jgi:replicative DNA helicase
MSDERRRIPQNPLAERSVLGALLLKPSLAGELLQWLSMEMFFSPAHREIFEAMEGLHRAGGALDHVTVGDALMQQGVTLEMEGGHKYLLDLVDELPTIENVGHWIDVVRANAGKRLRQQVADRAGDPDEDQADLDIQWEAAAALLAPRKDPLQHASALTGPTLDLIGRRVQKKERPIEPPWPQAKEALKGGFWAGLHVFNAGPGRGKTQFAGGIVNAALAQGVPTLYVSLELETEQIMTRLAALLAAEEAPDKVAAIPWSDLLYGRVPDAVRLLMKPMAILHEQPLWIEERDPFTWSPASLAGSLKRLRANAGSSDLPILAVIDYLQLVGASEKGGRRMELREVISKSAGALRAAAKSLGAAVLTLSSVSRENSFKLDEEAKEAPLFPAERWEAVGKESGEIEGFADTIMTMATGARFDRHKEMHIAFAKVRGGPAAWAKLNFNGGWFWDESGTTRNRGSIPGLGR